MIFTSNVKMIFDCAEDEAKALGSPLMLFFDEFDTIAQKRMHEGINPAVEHDHNAMVNSLLARLDSYDSFVIAATNRADAIDESVWRRFEIQIDVKLPGQFERERIVARYLSPFGLALIRGFCENLKRQIVVGPKCNWDMRRDAVIERLLAAILPHPDCGKPRLWNLGTKDHAIRLLTWPLMLAADIPLDGDINSPPATPDNVVKLGART
jgi:SpoVK/Ycf46/Vps4 family AAA+-type ATPase